jgi:hypothetical protein
MPVILATWEAEIERTEVQDHPRQKFHETTSQTTVDCGGTLPAMVGSVK